jgi:hypothetical protein
MAKLGSQFVISARVAFCKPAATCISVAASAKRFCQRPSTRLSLPKMLPSLRSAVVVSL